MAYDLLSTANKSFAHGSVSEETHAARRDKMFLLGTKRFPPYYFIEPNSLRPGIQFDESFPDCQDGCLRTVIDL